MAQEILTEEQVRNYHATLFVALARLNGLYSGKMMQIAPGGSKENAQLFKIINFNIVPVQKGGSKVINTTDIDDILRNNNIIDLVIMVRYRDYKSREYLAELSSFLSANGIKTL